MNIEKFIQIMSEENRVPSSWNQDLKKSLGRNRENRLIINTHLNQQHYVIKQTDLCKNKISLW